MKTFKTFTAIFLLAGSFPFTANADFDYPKLPWYEKYFFPLGCWVTPYISGFKPIGNRGLSCNW